MHNTRALAAAHPRQFGRAPLRHIASGSERRGTFADDFKLFASTFVAGFVFVSILIA